MFTRPWRVGSGPVEGETAMRILQIVGFVLGLVAFFGAAFYTGQMMGDTLWKVGVAFMLSVITLILLWPTGKKS
jgi:hypothetical protein